MTGLILVKHVWRVDTLKRPLQTKQLWKMMINRSIIQKKVARRCKTCIFSAMNRCRLVLIHHGLCIDLITKEYVYPTRPTMV